MENVEEGGRQPIYTLDMAAPINWHRPVRRLPTKPNQPITQNENFQCSKNDGMLSWDAEGEGGVTTVMYLRSSMHGIASILVCFGDLQPGYIGGCA